MNEVLMLEDLRKNEEIKKEVRLLAFTDLIELTIYVGTFHHYLHGCRVARFELARIRSALHYDGLRSGPYVLHPR